MRALNVAMLLFAAVVSGTALAADSGPPPEAWRDVAPEDLVLIDTRYGQVVMELAPEFAPGHVERIRKLLHAHFYDGKSFYRVVDGFVAQGGADEDTSATPDAPVNRQALKDWPPLKAEFDHPLFDDPKFTPLGNPDSFAPEVGFVDGFPAGRDVNDKREWVLHCPGTFAFARDSGDDTATTDFYFVIGEAPRRLDRNLTAFGRVLSGMQYLQKLERGDADVDMGVIQDLSKRDPILKMRLASDLPEQERPHWQVLRTDSAAFLDIMNQRRHPAPGFYRRPPLPDLDVCLVPVPVRLAKP